MGPSSVTGTAGSSLTVRCRYEQAYKGNNKYWCRGEYDTDCDMIVETKGKEKEERNGWVSIRDSTDDLTFTVTMKNLDRADAGSYWCKIQTVWILDAWSRDPSFQVQVSVSPGESSARSSSRPYEVRLDMGTRMDVRLQSVSGSCPQPQWCWEEPVMWAERLAGPSALGGWGHSLRNPHSQRMRPHPIA